MAGTPQDRYRHAIIFFGFGCILLLNVGRSIFLGRIPLTFAGHESGITLHWSEPAFWLFLSLCVAITFTSFLAAYRYLKAYRQAR
jgi:hypothetical protein